MTLNPLMTHRFGLNYVPSKAWYFCYNDWNRDDIIRDFAAIAATGSDHLRVMVVWPWFQPNPGYVSNLHLDRLDDLIRCAARFGMDVMPTLYTGWLSGYRFDPPFYQDLPFYTAPEWLTAQELFLNAVSARMIAHPNFLGFDIGNEINCAWTTSVAKGDRWMRAVLDQMHKSNPGKIHVNGVDNKPWFQPHTFSPRQLVARQDIVAMHCWPFWTGAGAHGGPLDRPYTDLGANMATLARSLANVPDKPIWVQEFGVCATEMPEHDIPRWMETFTEAAIGAGASWFTWWASHDVSRTFDFHPFEYGLGLITSDNQIKEQGRTFRRIADHWRGKPVQLPATLPPPPAARTAKATWDWMLDQMAILPR